MPATQGEIDGMPGNEPLGNEPDQWAPIHGAGSAGDHHYVGDSDRSGTWRDDGGAAA